MSSLPREFRLSSFAEVHQALCNPQLVQALYDEGGDVMEDVLLTLHGDAHKARRHLELRVFRRDFSRHYEQLLFPRTLNEALAPLLTIGHGDLVEFGYRVTMNLTADFAGIDRPTGSARETAALFALVKTFSEGATLVHSTRDHDLVRAEVREALAAFDREFLRPSIARRRADLAAFAVGDIDEQALPRDVLTVLLRNDDRLPMSDDLLRREIAFYLQAGSHSTANAMVHTMHELFSWCAAHPEDAAQWVNDPLFLQRAVHESLRLHPASPVAWRRAAVPLQLASGVALLPTDRLVLDLASANRDASVFGADADRFDPHRARPQRPAQPYGLTFGAGVHMCLGKDLDGGVVADADAQVAPPAHQFGIVSKLIDALLRNGTRPDSANAPRIDTHSQRSNWGVYPVLFAEHH